MMLSLLGVEVAMGLTPPSAEMSSVKEAPRAPSPQNDLCGVARGPCNVDCDEEGVCLRRRQGAPSPDVEIVLAMVRCAGTARFMTSFEGSSLNIVLDEYVGSLI